MTHKFSSLAWMFKNGWSACHQAHSEIGSRSISTEEGMGVLSDRELQV